MLLIRDAWQSPACGLPGVNAPAEVRSYWTKVNQILADVKGVIDDVNACI